MHGAAASEAVLTLACLLCRIEIAHQFDGRGEAGESASSVPRPVRQFSALS